MRAFRYTHGICKMDRYRNRGKIMADLNEFQSKIGYTFKNRHLLEQALEGGDEAIHLFKTVRHDLVILHSLQRAPKPFRRHPGRVFRKGFQFFRIPHKRVRGTAQYVQEVPLRRIRTGSKAPYYAWIFRVKFRIL